MQAEPRRKPLQSRSKTTVDCILAAAAQVLVKEGYAKATTNRVAAVAGVSIGTLYQYFPNKDALIVALVERHRSEMMSMLAETLASAQGDNLEQLAQTLISAMLKAHAVDPELHRALVEHLPKENTFQQLLEINVQAEEIICSFLELHQEQLRTKHLKLASFLVVTTVEAATHTAVLNRPALLQSEEFVRELSALVCRYLLA